MDPGRDQDRDLLRSEIELPGPGETVRVAKGALELVFERRRGALMLVTKHGPQGDGNQTPATTGGAGAVEPKRHYLGLPRDGQLVLEAKAPELRVQVNLLDAITLAPEGRLRGYVAVPLPHRLLWMRKRGRTEPLLDIVPKELQTSWLGEGEEGGYVHETKSRFYVERGEADNVLAALVPVGLRNLASQTISPTKILLSLRDRDLLQIAGNIVAAPRRLDWLDNEEPRETLRPMPGRDPAKNR